MVSLGQKIKLPKTCEKPFYKHIADVLCKKRLQKTIIILRNETIMKIEKMATMQRPFQRPFLSSLSKMVRLVKKIK